MAPTNDQGGAAAPSAPYEDASVTFIQDQVMASSSTQKEALSKVYQAVSQSVSLTVQDATDNLRNFSTVNLAALSYAQEKYVATQDPTWIPIIAELQKVLTTQIQTFAETGKDASTVLQAFLNPQTQSQQTVKADISEPEPTAPSNPEELKEAPSIPKKSFFNKWWKK